MTEILKFLHFIALAVAIGGGISNMVAGRQQARASAEVKPAFAALQKRVARLSALSLAVLWLTGIALVYAIYGGWTGLGTWFWIKIAAVAALTLVSGTAQLLMARRSPPPPIIKPLGLSGMIFAQLSVLFAVLAFTY
ncbi:MAG: hypothetical protein ACQEVT_17385 [Pseudomonadota bacterium]|uniref:hypothetical protein n=1 Tax=Roseovarius TaxID=74030 RepID=UPI0022A852F5|nr:hypothetical protein [Roseovarius sp. EGI FJ00037]MCZ0813510.1 hypothetical protein [Roseovarius sp. EGI FJ00037]